MKIKITFPFLYLEATLHSKLKVRSSPSNESDQPTVLLRKSRRNIKRPFRIRNYRSPDSVLGTSPLSSDENHHHKIKRILAKKKWGSQCFISSSSKGGISSNTNPTKNRGELRCSGRVGSSCSTSDTRRVNLVTNPVISHERGKDREVLMTSGTYPWSFVTQIFHNGQPSRGGDRKAFNIREP